jgi:putative ABC transport system substrate-binding protein
MRRREFVTLLGGAAVAMYVALAQQTKRIGYLSDEAAPPLEAQRTEPIWRSLRDLGYVEGANLAIERRYAGAEERLPAMAAELVALKPDLIFAVGSGAADAARFATGKIPS